MSDALRIITWKQLSQRVPYSRQHIARLEKIGKFPQRIRIGSGRGRVGWLDHLVDAWILERAKTSGIILPTSDKALTHFDGDDS